jgi:hypothetical protein
METLPGKDARDQRIPGAIPLIIYPGFQVAIELTGDRLHFQPHDVEPGRWQGVNVSKRAEAAMKEILNVSFQVPLIENLEHLRSEIKPNLPWADDHFEERVSGAPLNPGETWKRWPWALAADAHRTEGDKFTHTYMERYWPRYAGDQPIPGVDMNFGIRYSYGDLNDVINHLLGDPLTRQAYLPVWFPEDTGVPHGGRVPCTLGYHWILRRGHFHTTYYIRSCDFFRHFRDDLYLSARLTLWLLKKLRDRDPSWLAVNSGFFTFHCVSLHCFINDWRKLFHESR